RARRPISIQPCRCARHVLAFCGRRVGRRLHRRLCHRALGEEMTTLQSIEPIEQIPAPPAGIEVPAATVWPLVLALGFTLICAGLLTSLSVSVLGAVLTVAGCAGWFREVLPCPHEVVLPLIPLEPSITTERPIVDRLPIAPDQVRA